MTYTCAAIGLLVAVAPLVLSLGTPPLGARILFRAWCELAVFVITAAKNNPALREMLLNQINLEWGLSLRDHDRNDCS